MSKMVYFSVSQIEIQCKVYLHLNFPLQEMGTRNIFWGVKAAGV